MNYIEESWKWLPKYEVERLLLCVMLVDVTAYQSES